MRSKQVPSRYRLECSLDTLTISRAVQGLSLSLMPTVPAYEEPAQLPVVSLIPLTTNTPPSARPSGFLPGIPPPSGALCEETLGTFVVRLALTLTRRARCPRRGAAPCALLCDTCGKRGGLRSPGAPGGASAPGGAPAPGGVGGAHACALRRCAYCRVACYCSEACAAAGREAHDHQHQLRMIHFARPLDFKSNDYGACC